jgi:hypothetical protein
MGTPVKSVIGEIDRIEEAESRSRPFEDVIMLPIPMPLYAALSNAASKRGVRVADLIALGLTKALEG